MQARKSFIAVVVLLVLAFVPYGLAQSNGNPNPGVLPINSNAFGGTYAEWAAAYWQWALSFPLAVNPLFDETGEFQAQGQSGKVWFLAGSTGGRRTWVRQCNVPTGKAPRSATPWNSRMGSRPR